MKCPFCQNLDTQVKDSRSVEGHAVVRRRRACTVCGARFTTMERIQIRELTVVKRDGKSQPFDREKLAHSLHLALRKRDIAPESIEIEVNAIVQRLEGMGESEIPSRSIGAMVMSALRNLDAVAYIRFASVYRNFREVDDFEAFISKEGVKSASPDKT